MRSQKKLMSAIAVGSLVVAAQASTALAYDDYRNNVKVTQVEAFDGARFQITPKFPNCDWLTMWPSAVGQGKADDSESLILAALLSQKSVNVYIWRDSCSVEFLHISR